MTTKADADIRRREAADWFARLNQRKVTTFDVKAFSAWRRDPENARAFDRMQAMWEASGTLAADPDMAALSADAHHRHQARRRKKGRLMGALAPMAAAGALVLVGTAGWWAWSVRQADTYATAVGERRVLQLEDGSRVTLDTGSRIDVRFADDRRVVDLTSGQARFEVEGDPSRPFVVVAGDTRVTAVGTRFDVRRFGAGARVVLAEGRVVVRDEGAPERQWSLAPGQQVVTSVSRPEVVASDLPAVTSWAVGRLTFRETPVAVAVAEVNRYSRDTIELRAPEVSSVRVSGVFDAGDVDGFVAALSGPLRWLILSD